ncbi:MAG: ABC transporter ATP-binding protein [Spirochaetaceae bacterium]|nr:ABC transporter ATP-binding protein [Spirochaetaceae bacterium]MDT8299173.1 ABC transporter ATP-binding protein [Spirochaetaceae bacterium]
MSKKLLEVKNVHTSFFSHLGEIQAVRGSSFTLNEGDVLGIVGESGSGKSVTAMSIMGLIENPGKIKEGQILFDGQDLAKKGQAELSDIRGNEISMIFQDPMTSLNPVYTIENQMTEVLRRHNKGMTKKQAVARAIEMLSLVGIPKPAERIKSYPHEFSGGMRQRVMIATALSCGPRLLIADEPTTALDVTIQAQILDLMNDLKERVNASIILITHDLGVIAEVCDHIVVMYGGTIMEKGTVDEIFYNPQNPYTVGLHQSVPKLTASGEKSRLVPIEGSPPDLMHPPKGCPFSPRCPHAMKVCLEKPVPTVQLSETHSSACWLFHEDAPKVGNYRKGGEILE